jgi:hypothetical protein
MKKLLLAVIVSAVPAAAQTTVRVPVSGINATVGLGAAFDGARLGSAPMLLPTSPAEVTALILGVSFDPARLGAPPLLPNVAAFNPLAPTPGIPAELLRPISAIPAPVADSPLRVIRDASANGAQKTAALDQLFENSAPSSPEALAVSAQPAALTPQSSNEFSQAPAWFDVSKLKFDALVKSGTGGTAVLRYGWRSQYEMSVFAFPGDASVSFKEYSTNPMGHPKQSFDATLETAPGRKAAAKILRAAQARNPVSGKDKAALDEILTFLDGHADSTIGFNSKPGIGPIRETPRGGIEMSMTRPGSDDVMLVRWHDDAGFDFFRADGSYYHPILINLRGVRMSLLKATEKNGPTPLHQRLLEKLDAAIAKETAAAASPAAMSEYYTWHNTPRKNGTIFIGAGLPVVSVKITERDIEATIEGQRVAIGFVGTPDGPPAAMVFKREGETINVDLAADSPAITGRLSEERLSAIFKDSNIIISHGMGRYQLTLGDAPRLTSLQPGDVPQPVRRFAAYMLILRSIIGSWR